MAKTLYFNSKINKLNELEIRNSDAGQVVFVPYTKQDRCNKCALYLYKDSCLKTPCNEDDRKDKLTGYYRLYCAKIREEQPMPRPNKLMMILVLAAMLITGCTINMKVTIEHKIATPEAEKDSIEKNIETIWY